MVDIQSAATEIRRGKKKDRKKKDRNHRAKIKCPHLLRRATIISCWKEYREGLQK